MDFKQFNLASVQKYTSPQAMKDLDIFLDALPLNVGYNALIAAGLACLMGASSVWFASVELEKVSKLHSDLTNVQALQPPVPILKYAAVNAAALKPLADKVSATYKGITIAVVADGTANISAQDTDYFPQFIAAISYMQRGGKNWKVKINNMCVGRDCMGPKLAATLKIDVVLFSEPEAKKPDDKEPDKSDAVKK